MSINLERVAMLLHTKEQLLKHPHLSAVTQHVDAELNNLNAEATHQDLPERKLTKQEQEQAERQKAADDLKAKQEAEAQQQAKITQEELEQRKAADLAQARSTATQDQMLRSPQPRVPDPNAKEDLANMNHPQGTRIEDTRRV